MTPMKTSELFRIREYRPELDAAFLFSTWLKGLRHGNDWFALMEAKPYYDAYRAIIEDILKTATVSVACQKDDDNAILGYSVHTAERVHWVFVKSIYRGFGIARALLPGEFSTATHLTKAGVGYLRNHPKIVFNPFNLT